MSAAPAPRSAPAAGFYHCSVKSVGRANGRSVVAAAAYRAGERLVDEATGLVADYQLRHGVLETFIIAPGDAPAWARDREQLWNAAERAEPRANGRLATELELGLPHELTDAQRRELLTGFVRGIVERHGVAADVAIHAPGAAGDHRNMHAHVLITHRELGADGFGEVSNARTTTKKVKGQEKAVTIYGIAANPSDVVALRQQWEQVVNRAYERAGLDIRVDHRSHAERGIEQEPSKHLGPTATAMERRGVESERGAANREITQRNAERGELAGLEAEAREIGAQIIDLAAEREARAGRYDPVRAAEQEAQRAQFKGRYDELRDATPPPEPVRAFEAGAARATEPPAVNFDRDAAEAAWLDQVAAAGIAKAEAARPPEKSERAGEAREHAEGGIPTYRAPSENAPAATTARPNVAPELETAKTPAAEIHDADRVAGEIDAGLRGSGSIASRITGSFTKIVENVLGGLFGFFVSEPKLTRQQTHDLARANDEARDANAVAAARQEHEAAQDWLIFEQNRQQQYDDLMHGRAGRTIPREIERDDDDRGRERER